MKTTTREIIEGWKEPTWESSIEGEKMTTIECELDTTCKHRSIMGVCLKDNVKLAEEWEDEWTPKTPCNSFEKEKT